MSQPQTEAEVFILKYPFTTAAGEEITQLVLKRLTVKDLKQIKKTYKDPADWDEPLISRSTGLLPEDMSLRKCWSACWPSNSAGGTADVCGSGRY